MNWQIKTNYQKMLDDTIFDITSKGKRPSLLMHACCAPCSSYVIEYLSDFFDITLLYYNPNISPESEYFTRADELIRLADEFSRVHTVSVNVLPYTPDDFNNIACGLENMPEGGARCFKCYRLRLEKSAVYAKENGFDYFCTTLSISPHKNADVLNKIGSELSIKYGIQYLYSDFKKKNGYLRSCQLSEKYSLYRQDSCGCIYSKINK